MIRITFIRHGESTWNAAHRWQGHGDAPLSDLGLRQASDLGTRLADSPFDCIESSDLSRAAQTAAALCRPVVARTAWRELALGAWEGLAHSEVEARYADELAALRRGEPVKLGGGESWPELTARVMAALADLRARLRPGDHAAVVCHGGVILALTSALFDLPATTPRPVSGLVNTSVTTFAFSDDEVVLERYNDATHLGADRPPRARTGAVAEQITAPIEGLLSPVTGSNARLGPLDPGHVGHLVTHRFGRTLADWNVPPETP